MQTTPISKRSGERWLIFLLFDWIFNICLSSKPEPPCNTQAGDPSRAQPGIKLSVTGVFAMSCKHGFFLPNGVIDFSKGEGWVHRYIPNSSIITSCAGIITLMWQLHLSFREFGEVVWFELSSAMISIANIELICIIASLSRIAWAAILYRLICKIFWNAPHTFWPK